MTAPGQSPLQPLLETLEDASVSLGERTDAYLTLTSRMTGEGGKEVIIEIEKNLPRLYRVLQAHIASQNSELSSAALQALGFCLYNPKIASGLSEANTEELLLKLNNIIKSSDKNVCTRALWVISKQTFPPDVVGKMVSSIIDSLEVVFNKGEIHSAIVDFEALNVIIRLIEQAPVPMAEESVRWAKLVIPLVVHSAQKVHLRGATALEMGMPLLLQKQQEIASITEHLMTTKLIPELQKLFMNKNETYVLKLWPLFIKLLGKTLHRSGSFINSLLQLEELGFRSAVPMIKKIAFIAWKSLIDNFALNPDILCSAKRLKLLMQPLSSIHVRTETLALTKLEVWWYLLMRLGTQLPSHFEQVCVPLIQNTISLDSSALLPGSSSRVCTSPGLSPMNSVHKGASPYGVGVTPRMNQSSAAGGMITVPSIQLLGLEMLLHFFLGPEVFSFAKQHKFILSLEPLEHALISSPSFFSKHAHTLITAVHDSFIAVGKDASDAVVTAIWKELISLVKSVTESGNKERPGSEVLTLLLKSLENIVKSEVFPVSKTLILMEITIKELPQKVLGSPAYQVANMDILNGTPALFLIQLIFNNNLLECGLQDERFFVNLETLVDCVLSGPASPLAFSDSVLNVINENAKQVDNKEHLWRMWSIIVTPLTNWINQTSEVNQGDALEHNFSAIYGALTLPVNHIFSVQSFPMVAMKTLLKTWSELYRVFARCAALVATAEENLCCEELSSKIMSCSEDEALSNLLFLDRIAHIVTVMVECIDFSPYNVKCQPQIKSPRRSSDWSKKKKEPLGKLASLFEFIVRVIYSFHTLSFKETHSDTLLAVGNSIITMLSSIFGHISLSSMIRKVVATLTRPLALLYETPKTNEIPKVYSCLNNKLEKLLGEMIACLQFSYTGAYDSELLEELSPLLCITFLHKNKQIRKQCAVFWNATFAKVIALVYPEELKPVLRQAKENSLLLLPGLENVEMMEESCGPYSNATENSQLNIKISGMERKSSGKRDSFLVQKKDKKENVKTPAKPKLESSSPKVKSDKLLEEEKSTDFVFIPPEDKEAKERILTEHQKEVLKTKRYDIPALYNNLDVSQDTLFSTQFSQDESMESSTLTEKPKDISKMAIKEDTDRSCEMDEHLQKTSLPDECGSTAETNPEIPNTRNDARKNTVVSSKKMSTECTANAESSLVASNSSVSNATVFGTPPQSTSRRQTFITLEKFDGSENRPFSPSPLNDMSSTVTVRNNQENRTKTDTPPKTRKREVTHSKSSSEKSVNGIKRLSRRCKIEQSGNKRSKLSLFTESEACTQQSVEGMITLENNSPDLLSQTEGVPDSQDHLSAVEDEDTKPKPATENAVPENKATEEKNIPTNLDSKENTPPPATPTDEATHEDSQAPIVPNPKILRRSSRRRSELDSSTDSQDKENSQQKKERRKEEKKVQKSPVHVNDKLPMQIITSEQTIQENLTEKGNNLHEKTLGETSVNALIDQNKRTDLEHISYEGDGGQDIVDKSSEKPLRVRTRYQTRRFASQGLLSSIENSESDSSDAKEEMSRKKRSGKWKNRSSDSVEIEEQEEKMAEECVKTESQARNYKAVSDDARAQVCAKGESNHLQDSTTASDLLQVSDVSDIYEGKDKASKCIASSFTSPPVPESNLRTRNASKRFQKGDSDSSVSEPSRTEAADTSVSEKDPLTLECQHKRSRRVRRFKGCDCCGQKSPQEKSFIGLKNTADSDGNTNVQTPRTVSEACEAKRADEQPSMNFHLDLKEENNATNGLLILPETESKENTQKSLPSEMVTMQHKTCNTDSSEGVSESHKPCDDEHEAVDPCLGDSKGISQEHSHIHTKEENPEASVEREPNIIVEENTCKVAAESEEVEAMELDVDSEKSEAGFPEKECAEVVPSEEVTTEENESEEPQSGTVQVNSEVMNSEVTAAEFSLPENHTPVKRNAQTEAREQVASGAESCETEMNTEMESNRAVIGQVNSKVDSAEEGDVDKTTNASKSEEADSLAPDTLKVSTEDGKVGAYDTKPSTGLKSEQTQLNDDQILVGNDILQQVDPTSEKVEELPPSLPSEMTLSELASESNNASPDKFQEFDPLLVSANESPSGMQARCVWSPLASPSISILKRGLKRSQDDETVSPLNKVRRVSFADPIYQAGLAEDIDRRCAVRAHSANSSPIIKSVKTSPTVQPKHNANASKGFLSPGSRSSKFKSSKKCLITEMTQESMLSISKSVYPALVNCAAPVDIILPQITSNLWTRGIGQLIRAKNIKTIGDLSILTASEIKTLPIRSPKVSTVKKALRLYHEQQVKSRGLEEIPVFDLSEKAVNGVENKPLLADEEKLASDLMDPVPLATPLPKNLVAQVSALARQLDAEDLYSYSGSQLFEMHEKLGSMANSIMKNLRSRWRSPAHEDSTLMGSV